MISKKSRLNRSEIEEIKLSPLKHQEGGLLILYQKNQLNYPKIAVVVSKKINKLAVQRNLIKRNIIDIVSLEIKKYPHSSFSLIIYPSQKYLQLSPEEKEKTFTNIFKSIC